MGSSRKGTSTNSDPETLKSLVSARTEKKLKR